MDGGRAASAPLPDEVAVFDSTTAGIRKWLVGLFVQAIGRTSHPEERHAAIVWLIRSRDILAGDLGFPNTLMALHELLDARTAASAMAAQVAAAVRDYRTADLPWPMKMAIPATVLATPVVGLQGAAMAALGTAVGVPAMLLVFLGMDGITAVIEGAVANPHSDAGIALVAARILQADAMQGAAKWIVDAMIADPVAPRAAALPREEAALRAALLAMDPHRFARHVMSFFEKAGLEAVATPRSADHGLYGCALHPRGLIVVQCKRCGLENKIGGPAVRQFRTAIADAAAWRGYVVTTSCFTAGAVSEAAKEGDRLVLVDMDALVRWHAKVFTIAG